MDKFIDGRNEMGIAGMFETGMGISGNDVTFFASIIDEYRPGITLGRSEVKESKPETGGKSQNPSLMAELKRTWYEDRNFVLQKQELSGSTFYIMDQKTLAPPTNISGQINLVISKSEYDSIAIPSNMDTTVHTPLLSFGSFGLETDNNGVPYRKAALKVTGTASNGIWTGASLGFDLLTFNYDTLNTEAAGNVVDLEEAENGLIDVQTLIDDIKNVEETYPNDSLAQTCLRIRVHYYGNARDLEQDYFLMDYGKGIIFDNTIPQLKPGTEGYKEPKHPGGLQPGMPLFRPRKLYEHELSAKGALQTWNRLTSHADENGPKDNPSPYLLKGSNEIDLGQVLYGFESIFYQHHVPPSTLFPPPTDSYSPSYENFPVKIVNDLAGWLANIATPAAEYFIHVRDGVSPYEGKVENPPNTLQEYFDFSAPDADLFGNADGIGIWWAYQVLSEANPPDSLKLSDVFTLYYLGASQLRPEIDPLSQNPMHPFHTSDKRWKMFSLFFGFMEPDGSGGFNWIPDDATAWAKVKGLHSDDPLGRNYEKRLMGFAEFWYTKYERKYLTALDLVFNLIINNDEISHFDTSGSGNFSNSGKNEKDWVKDKINTLFETYFLNSFLKSEAI